MAEYVYGIVASGATAPDGTGIAGAPLRVVGGDRAAALVSEVSGDTIRLGREELLTHSGVLERALGHGTVLPMRFGVVMSGREEIEERLLDPHAEDLVAQLQELDGKVEIRIRAVYDEERLLTEIVRDDRRIEGLRNSLKRRSEAAGYYDRIRLGELVSAAIERRRERDAEIIAAALAKGAIALEIGDSTHERVVINASFLVARAQLEQFDAILDDVAEGYGGRITFKYTGPLPPHSFVALAEVA